MFTTRPHTRLPIPRRRGSTPRRLPRLIGVALAVGAGAAVLIASPAAADDPAEPFTTENIDIDNNGVVDGVAVRDANGKVVEVEIDDNEDGEFDELWIYEDGVRVGIYQKPGADGWYGELIVKTGSKVEVHTDNDGVGDTFDQVRTYDADKGDARPELELDRDGDGVFDVLVVPLPGGGTEVHTGEGDDELYNRIVVDQDGDRKPEKIHIDDNDDGHIDTTILVNPDGTIEGTIDHL